MSGRIVTGADMGIVSYAHHDPDGDKLTVEEVQDVEPILEFAKTRTRSETGWSHSRAMRWLATIPGVIYGKLLMDGTAKDPERLRRWLRDPDNRDFCNRNKSSGGIIVK